MDFLYEIGVEDLPSRFLTASLRELKTLAEKKLTELKLDHGEITTLGTPRRLTLHIAGLAEEQPSVEEIKTGPPVSVAFDGDGNPTRAAVSFAAKFGATEAELAVVETEKGQRVQLTIASGGAKTAKLLPDLARSLITELPLPRAMRWGTVSQTFLRPIRWLVALCGEEVVEFKIAGVQSGNRSRG
ncbi:glycine--tRNA ligase subunit beta, partial [bacterium]|nr:glycine--tRNA ligase subunit beta [bacterium]